MRDEERYPIPITSSPDFHLPEVAPTPPPKCPQYYDPQGQDKFFVQQLPPPESHDTTADFPNHSPPLAPAKTPARILGLRRITFWILTGGIGVLVIVGAVVGGVVGSMRAREGGSSSGTTQAQNRQIAASASTGTSSRNGNIQVFYQDLDTTDLLYRLIWNGQSETEQRATLSSCSPQADRVIAVANTETSSNKIQLDVFYLANDSSNATLSVICQATLECVQGAKRCDTIFNEVISQNAANGVDAASGLSTTLLPNTSSLRVYYRAPGNALRALAGNDPKQNGWSDMKIGGPSTNGSGIASYHDETSDTMDVILVNDDLKALREISYDDVLGPDNANRTNVAGSPGHGWALTSRFSACYEPDPTQHHIYYVASTGSIFAYARNDSSFGTWDWIGSNPKWGSPVGGIAAVAWDHSVRLLYMSGDPPVILTGSFCAIPQ